MSDFDFDVVVIGAGGAGLAAAATAAEDGADVLVVEAGDQPGGSTALSGGSVLAAGTSIQRQRGISDDDPEDFFNYYMTINQWQIDPAVARRYCESAGSAVDWLSDLGVEFPPEHLSTFALERFPRVHAPVGQGAAVADALYRQARKTGCEFAFRQRVDKTSRAGAGAMTVTAGECQVTARSVILTTGGFGQNPDLLRRHYPLAARCAGEALWSISGPMSLGDGLAIGDQLGAETTGHDHGLLLLHPVCNREPEPYLPSWLVFVDDTGSRFVNERAPYAILSKAVIAAGGHCWAILDETTLLHARSKARAEFGAGFWSLERLREATESCTDGNVVRADTLQELASGTGLPLARLDATIRRYNADCDAEVDVAYGKRASTRRPVREAPFTAVRMVTAAVAITNYGLRIDRQAQVLSRHDGMPIAGLYAAGEVTGNVMGDQYVGSGNSVGSAITFGRIAGSSATAHRSWAS